MAYAGEKYEIAHNGKRYRVEVEHDPDTSPFDFDGHGPVREGTRDRKRPGERVIGAVDRWGDCHLYDWQAAMRKAKREGWRTNNGGTVVDAVQADFDYLDGWLRDQWHYVCVVVTPLGVECECCGHSEEGEPATLCGIESDSDHYITADVIPDLIAEIEAR